MDSSALFAIIHNRRSVRRYQDRPVPEAALHQMLEAARWAPSAHNRQHWRFVVSIDPSRRAQLTQAMGQHLRDDLTVDGIAPKEIERRVRHSSQWIGTAPAVIVVFVSYVDVVHYADARRQDAERLMAVQSVALAVQNMLLMAHAEGLGVCWSCAPLFCPDVVRQVLALPADWEAQALLTVGYPAEQCTRDRDPIETKTIWY